ncbi:hypothetical protein NPX13_g3159 [Xylaria arbuscula]|uniref:Mitochondrial division protein 1 n=1 Tax=Xylaria arbuscula TaxID=114810 RepID=A0A9W8NIF1_9PEZI|nr:hypothetical protein NPX13_g3159 [Xylaria arbuscula]
MSLLTSRQADELHKSIIAYLTANRLIATAAALRTELNLGENEFDPATAEKYQGLLEKKWTSVDAGELERTIKGHTRAVLDVEYGGPRGSTPLASCSSDLTIKLWDPANDYKNIRTLPGHDHSVSALRFIPGSANLLVSASRDQTLKIWDVITGFCLKTLKRHTGWVRDVFPSFDGRYLLSCGDDMTARLWDISSTTQPESKITMFGHEHHIECCAIAPPAAYKYIALAAGLKKPPPTSSSAEYMATGSRDKTIRLWDARGTCILSLVGHDNWIRALVFHPGGKYLLSVSDDRSLRCWDLNQDGRCVKVIRELHEGFITSLQWAPSIVRNAEHAERLQDEEVTSKIVPYATSKDGIARDKPGDVHIRCVIATAGVDCDSSAIEGGIESKFQVQHPQPEELRAAVASTSISRHSSFTFPHINSPVTMEGGFENPLPIPPRHHGNANNEYAGLGERRITHPSRYYEIIAGARRILEGRLESLDEEERGRYDENIRTQASKHEPVARVADEERWEKDAYVDDWSNIELLPSRLTAPWFGTFAMKTPRDADKQERWANRLLETYDSENPQGMSWCPISHGYLDKSDVVAAHIVRYNVGEPAAVHLFGPTDDPGGHIWSLSNGIPMHKRYQAALYDGRIAIIPTEDGEDLKVVVLEDALRRIQTVPGEPPYGQSLHERVLKFLNNDHHGSSRVVERPYFVRQCTPPPYSTQMGMRNHVAKTGDQNGTSMPRRGRRVRECMSRSPAEDAGREGMDGDGQEKEQKALGASSYIIRFFQGLYAWASPSGNRTLYIISVDRPKCCTTEASGQLGLRDWAATLYYVPPYAVRATRGAGGGGGDTKW